MALPPTDSGLREFLFDRINYEQSPASVPPDGWKLDRVRRLLERLDHPHDQLRIVHVAGTKGKGSTCHLLESLLRAQGCSTGLYTSPHLLSLTERFRLNGQPCSETELDRLIDRVRPEVRALDAAGSPPTFFEITTALAFLHFAEQQVDWAVIEVGMGGRLDSTNVCHPELAIVTTISLDHTEHLGTTIPAITREKAGIIKAGVPVVSGLQQAEAREVLFETAARTGSLVRQLDRDFRTVEDEDGRVNRFAYFSWRRAEPLSPLQVPLLGKHQVANAALALAALDQLAEQGHTVRDEAIAPGLLGVSLPARTEWLGGSPGVLLDAAHNPASFQALLDVLRALPARRLILVLAVSRDKEIAQSLAAAEGQIDHLIVTRYQSNPRGMELATLARSAEQVLPEVPLDRAETPLAAWHLAMRLAQPDDLICIAGSFFLAAELRDRAIAHGNIAT